MAYKEDNCCSCRYMISEATCSEPYYAYFCIVDPDKKVPTLSKGGCDKYIQFVEKPKK